MKVIRQDEYFAIYDSRNKNAGLLVVNLRAMQEIAEKGYDDLKMRYKELTRIEIPTVNDFCISGISGL